jgi:ubiquinone/menaquinone biosynthesis C-methylase UbiE
MFTISFVLSIIGHARTLVARPSTALPLLACLLIASVFVALPLLLHRLLSPRLPGIVATLPFPVTHTALLFATAAVLRSYPIAPQYAALFPVALVVGAGIPIFLVDWFAAALVRGWNYEFRSTAWSLRNSLQRRSTLHADMSFLRSPATGASLQSADPHTLVSPSGETFPIRNGIPNFLRPQDLTGANLKYNHLYETIGGFYDDSQRVICALSAMDRDAYVHGYLDLLEVHPGNTVLETSIGTGLNFKYLPRDIHRFGLDLSPEMLAACQQNMRRWNMDAELFLGNAEALPFADSSFDVVFHVGGINFFSDRAAAIHEMIRVAKPGSLLLIADETEEHVKDSYENIPITREYFKGRTDSVAAPIDLVPPGMEDIHLRVLEIAGKKRFYALTFRKPSAVAGAPSTAESKNLEPSHA